MIFKADLPAVTLEEATISVAIALHERCILQTQQVAAIGFNRAFIIQHAPIKAGRALGRLAVAVLIRIRISLGTGKHGGG